MSSETDFNEMFGDTGKFDLTKIMGEDTSPPEKIARTKSMSGMNSLGATATGGFMLGNALNLKAEVTTLREFALKFVDNVERMFDIEPHKRDWQTAMIRLKQDAETLLE